MNAQLFTASGSKLSKVCHLCAIIIECFHTPWSGFIKMIFEGNWLSEQHVNLSFFVIKNRLSHTNSRNSIMISKKLFWL